MANIYLGGACFAMVAAVGIHLAMLANQLLLRPYALHVGGLG